MPKSRYRLTNPLRFVIERQFVKGAQYQLMAVVALIGLISFSGGILAKMVAQPEWEFGESVWWAFLRLTDPGYLGDDEGTWLRIISTFLTVSGYVVFLGALVAIMTQWLTSKMRELEQGLTPVAVKNHIVILGWTNRTHSIVVEFFESVGKMKHFLARLGEKKLKLVILAENSSAQLTRNLKADQQIGKRADEIILRTGDPLQMEHLLRVDCYNASAIIIPSYNSKFQDFVSADVETIKTLLSLSSNPKIKEKNQLPYVVAEIQDEKKINVARRAYPGPLEIIAGDSIISRLIAQNVRHVGLSEVYEALLSKGLKSDLYTRNHPALTGKRCDEIERLFPRAIFMGVVRVSEGQFTPILNVSNDFVVQSNDRLVFLAGSHEDTEPAGRSSKPKKLDLQTLHEPGEEHTPVVKMIRLLILGWNNRIPALIHEFGSYIDQEIEVTVVSVLPASDREKKIDLHGGYVNRVACTQVEADYINEAELREVNPGAFDHIILLSTDQLQDTEEADARTIVGKILLDEILDGEQNQPHILVDLANPGNSLLLKKPNTELIISPIILSHLLAQVALRRELQSIYTELFTVGGAEIEFKSIEHYGLGPGNYTFEEVEQVTALVGETAIGVFKNKKNGHLKNKLILNPPKNEYLTITENDEFVVLMTY